MSTDGRTGWDGAKWASMSGKQPNTPGAPMLRTEAPLQSKAVADARLYVSALGVYDAYVNGQRVTVPQDGAQTTELLTPGWTDYETTVNYMTYDVTSQVSGQPQVTLAAVLGNGWYNSRIGASSKYYSEEGHPLALKAKLRVRYTDGSVQNLVTAPGAGWKATDQGPYRSDDIYDGQAYDARQEMQGWTGAGFDTTGWAEAVEDDFAARFPASKLVAYPGETARLMSKWDRDPQSVVVYNQVEGAEASANGKGHIVVDQSRSVDDPAKAAAAQVTISAGETAIFDLGQNMVGVPKYTVTGPAGAEIAFKFGEILNDGSAGADGPEGSVYRANLRTAMATSTYILKGDPAGETHQDSLTYYGFRYASVTVNTPGASVIINDFTGKVATSAVREAGNITTNDPLINQLYSNIQWGQRGNYLWVPTDCPQRDERQGWTGDTQVFANTGLYNADSANFLSHFQDSLVQSQQTYGTDGAQFPMTAPGGAFKVPVVGVSGWADAGVVLPWTIWQMSGDASVIDRNWTAMTKYVDWITARTGATYSGQDSAWGDWLAPQATSTQFISDAYYAYSTKLLADMAKATGREGDASKYGQLFQNIKRAFMLKYVSTNVLAGELTIRSGLGLSSALEPALGGPVKLAEDNSQTALTWVLKLGLYENETQRKQVVNLLSQNIGNSPAYKAANPLSTRVGYAENTLSVGFLGINVLAPTLTDNGRSDLAYKLLHQDAMPSWLYSVKNGATTMWERWNSYSTEEGFGPVAMNSFNHYSYGAIGEWMYEDMAGIAKDPANPGFKHFFLQPQLDPTGKITNVKGSHMSPYGEIASQWSVSGATLSYQMKVPANTRATLKIPTLAASTVREGTTPLSQSPGVTFLGFADGVATYQLESGSYKVTSTLG
ncbi:family 78 glycoside hydrolase catalytic domain [Pseudarthrobacter scleromae]|uniref:family 78 glycoside hydrolase catalytic domain n=1 Tax=Pseudarthrobacter scleromae TaxID=158897 RepID=UPI003CFEFE05